MRMKVFGAYFIIASADSNHNSVERPEEASGCWMSEKIERPVPLPSSSVEATKLSLILNDD